ncbi:hypothetical protein BGZ95_011056 [Linnemannia exigua]|uniref:F-box domain-containing protein n=1 Tax=Linnemannia exigua TaxID=604196 RepID=A0AAD4DAD9_9FUNG|nr:hypothetical protein BGZ95_011056 [Linnemannia exigua]
MIKGVDRKGEILTTIERWRTDSWRRQELRMPTLTTAARNTLDLPELRHRLSRFVTIKDALSCALVCKAWTDSFTSAIWFSIDFDVHPRFVDLSPDTIAKHGHLIRVVKNAKEAPQVAILANSRVNNLRHLHIDPAGSAIHYVRAYEIVFRNNMCCKSLYMSATTVPTAKLDSFGHYIPAHALSHSPGLTLQSPSILKVLRLRQLCLTHDSLVVILQGCPKLIELDLIHTNVVGDQTQSFQHVSIKDLRSSLQSIFQAIANGPPLLSYFPRLTAISIYSFDPSVAVPTTQIKEDLLRYCPDVTRYNVEDAAGAIISEFLLYVAHNITEFTYKYEHTSIEMVTGMLAHQNSLKSISQFHEQDLDFETETVASVSDPFRQSGIFLQLILRCCSQLRTLDLHSHEMDMDVVEMGEWTCQDLTTLRIRVKGLDTVDKILKAIALWRAGCWRRWQQKAGTPVQDEVNLEEINMSIEAKVARHLLKFDKLWWVWLGYQTWTPI